MGAGYNFLLIPSWTRRGRDCLFPSRLKRSDKILQAKISAKTWGDGATATFPLRAVFPLWGKAWNFRNWDAGKMEQRQGPGDLSLGASRCLGPGKNTQVW